MKLSVNKTVLLKVDNNDIKPDGSFDIPYGVTSIGALAFDGCRKLHTLIIPKGVTFIAFGAFQGCSRLKTLIIPNGVVSIENNVFNGCSNLQTLSIPEKVTSIGLGAFYGCSSLKTLIIPKGVVSIGNDAFNGCSNLQTLSISNGVTFIGFRAFHGCTKLQTLIIPKGIASVEYEVFMNCISLETITIPEGVTFIGVGAFYKCPNLQNIIIASKDDEEIKRITALLPQQQHNKVTPMVFVEKASELIKCQLANIAQTPETNPMYRFFNLNSRFSPKVQVKNKHGQSVQVECKKLPDEIFQYINRFNNPFAVKAEKHMHSVPLPKNEYEMIDYQKKVEKIAHDAIKEAKKLHTAWKQKPYEQVKTNCCALM